MIPDRISEKCENIGDFASESSLFTSLKHGIVLLKQKSLRMKSHVKSWLRDWFTEAKPPGGVSTKFKMNKRDQFPKSETIPDGRAVVVEKTIKHVPDRNYRNEKPICAGLLKFVHFSL